MNAINEQGLAEANVLGGLVASFILVDLTISEWVGRKTDKKNTHKIVADNNAKAKDAAHVTKKLFVENAKLEEIGKAVGAIRTYVDDMTVPWIGKLKLLPMARYMEFQEHMGELEAEFYVRVNAFLTDYDTQIAAMAFTLGSLFNRAEYPTEQEIRGKFSVGWNYLPVPTAGDFRVDAENALRQNLQEAYTKAMNKQVEDTMALMWGRLQECLSHLLDRLGTKEDGKPNIFRDTLIGNAKELVNLLGVMNITNDPQMEMARRQMHALLDGVEPDELRKNKHIRDDVRASVKDLMDKFSF